MKLKMLLGIIAGLVIMMTVFMVGAVDDQGNVNDPTVNERANSCYEGGSMEGRCNTQLEWDAGWYLIRFEFGLLERGEVPSWVAWVIPPEVVPEALSVASVSRVCIKYSSLFFTIFENNVSLSGSTIYGDSNCLLTAGTSRNDFVLANNLSDAIALCQTVGSYSSVLSYSNNSWLCQS